jgi:hypothetical protein
MDISQTIAPKSNQLNFDDFLSGESKTIKITNVSGTSEAEQPIAINYEGDNGKPYKPSKGMRRVLVSIWGKDSKVYIGRSLTLYGDPKVRFGAQAVGGIRISHMSDITESRTLALTESKANKKPFVVQPLTKTKPELTPDYKGWEGAKKAIVSGTHTIEQLREKYVISEDNEKLLKP